MELEEQFARIWAGVSPEKYEHLPGIPYYVDDENPGPSKSEILVMYRSSKQIEAVVEDARARKMKVKKGGR